VHKLCIPWQRSSPVVTDFVLVKACCLTPLPLRLCQVRQKQDSAALEYGHQVLKPICNSSGDRELLSEAVTLLGSAACLDHQQASHNCALCRCTCLAGSKSWVWVAT
jgi:hypothetical protein